MSKVKTNKRIKGIYYIAKTPTRFMYMIKNYLLYLIEDKGYNTTNAIETTFFKFSKEIINHPYYKQEQKSVGDIHKAFVSQMNISLSNSKSFGQVDIRKKAGMLKPNNI